MTIRDGYAADTTPGGEVLYNPTEPQFYEWHFGNGTNGTITTATTTTKTASDKCQLLLF